LRRSKQLIAAACIAAALGVAGFALAAGVTVTLTPSGAQPPRVTVALGDTVTFSNGTPESRTLTSTFEGFGTTTIPAGANHEYVAVTPGTIQYRFGTGRDDRGVVIVQRVGSVTLEAGRRSVTFGQPLTLSGRANPAGFPVTIEERLQNGTVKPIATVTPAADGSYSHVVRPTIGTQYRSLLFNGALRSQRVSVQVRPRVVLTSSTKRAKTGTTVSLRARVTPAAAARRVELSLYNPKRQSWRRVSTTRLTNGRATIPWKVVPGRSRLRAVISSRDTTSGFEGATSAFVSITGIGPVP
jgi:hypothetical protein